MLRRRQLDHRQATNRSMSFIRKACRPFPVCVLAPGRFAGCVAYALKSRAQIEPAQHIVNQLG